LKLQVELLSGNISNDKKTSQTLDQINYVLKQMGKNGVKPDRLTHALLFQKNVQTGQLNPATKNLRVMLDDS